ncbi:hypothetical protein FBU59_000310 [Linderina macrospora]|uniref:Uncharacterized protein n=1 Tax=Linderina macrospora TaxID=4868 RepID=A0ACC1JH80_9FUNG|nr:hypothetical protein FBU59_000310 [Linderina macrospora]
MERQVQSELVIRISSSPCNAVFHGENVYGATSIPVDSLDTSLVQKVILQFDNPAGCDLLVAKLFEFFDSRDWSTLRYVSLHQCYYNEVLPQNVVDGDGRRAADIMKRIIALIPSVNGLRLSCKDWCLGRDGRLDEILGQRAATLNELSFDQLQPFDLSRLALPSLTVLDIGSDIIGNVDTVLPQLYMKALRKLTLQSVTKQQFVSLFSDKTGAVSVFSELEYLDLIFSSDENEDMEIDDPQHAGIFSFPKLRYLHICNHRAELRYFFQNFIPSPLARLRFYGRCGYMKDIDFSVFGQLEEISISRCFLQLDEAAEIHRRVVTAGIPLRLVSLGLNCYPGLPYIKPTGCSLVRKYATAAVMDAVQLSETLVQMPLVFRFAFKYHSMNTGSVTIEEIVNTLANADMSPLNSKLEVLQALGSQNIASIGVNSLSTELAEMISVIARLPMLQILEISTDPVECELLLKRVMDEFQSRGLGQELSHFGSLQIINSY